ncbi:MAG: DEAD/DEAH box helicase [Gallionella sp.]|nr:DEAD/DEAH box helicase [Gallionella sp.]
MSDSSSFYLLDERIRRYIWAEGWESLRDAQELAIPLIIDADKNVIIAAATAAGKTEAAFLPALTHLLQNNQTGLIVYISPLKALINDQFGRLERLCENLEIPVWPWHGDISATTKKRFMSKPHGVLLITPESMEAILCNRGTSVKSIFKNTAFFIVDELHAFIGSERGKQLQSLMHRIEQVLARTVPRIGLSATLGDMSLASDFLCPGKASSVSIVQSKSQDGNLKIMVKGYEEPLVVKKPNEKSDKQEKGEPELVTPALIATHLFESLYGSNNLVFPNSRREVERFTHLLNLLCKANKVPNEFWPHHGSLSKEIRAETEEALKKTDRPATAICTNTLELGIDIGAVKSVAQIGPPPSVASLRQRLGRSGRRKGESAILRGYCIETALGENASLADELRLDTVQMAAMILLLLEGWLEAPKTNGLHFSTLIQQILSSIAQNGGASIGNLYGLLCGPESPFYGVTKDEFVELVRHLGSKEMLMQDSSGDLLHGQLGEKFVNHYTFYAAFVNDEEFRIVAGGKTLGTLPVHQMLVAGQRILFAGKTWRVESVDEEQKTIYVTRTSGGVPPLFSGGGGRVDTRIRQRMRQLLEETSMPSFLDEAASRFLTEARGNYKRFDLKNTCTLDFGREVFLLTWLGDAGNEALACMLMAHGLEAVASGLGVEIQKNSRSMKEILNVIIHIPFNENIPLDLLLVKSQNLYREKWDWVLPEHLLHKSYASLYLNQNEALKWLEEFIKTPNF